LVPAAGHAGTRAGGIGRSPKPAIDATASLVDPRARPRPKVRDDFANRSRVRCAERSFLRHHVVMAASPPPLPMPKRRNAFWRLYDLPLYRDWAAWATLAMLVITTLALGTGEKAKTGTPRWADVLWGTPTFVVLFGVLPAFLRLVVRRRRWLRVQRRSQPPPTRSSGTSFTSPWEPPVPTAPAAAAPAALDVPPAPPIPSRSHRMSAVASESRNSGAQNAAVPIGAVPPSILAESELLSSARRRLQYPIARAVRAIQLASDKREEYEAVLSTGEAIAITIGVSIAASLRGSVDPPPAFQELQRGYLDRGVTQGQWITLIAATANLLRVQPEPLRGLSDALRRGKGGSGLVEDLRIIVEERNRWAHGGGPRTPSDAVARLGEMAPALERAITRSLFLVDSPWILVRSSSYRRAHQDFAVLGADAMADHPDFERRDLTSPVPLADDTLYMLTGNRAVDLTPFIAMHDCPECHQAELCHADRLDPRFGVALKSFARGHLMYEPGLADELTNLFHRSNVADGH
jgi:hypothetical protein